MTSRPSSAPRRSARSRGIPEGPPLSRTGADTYRPINDYALIGDAGSAALVASDGAIDWLCLPHFDDPAVLCRLLDAHRGGFLSITPALPLTRTERRYRAGSNVLETDLTSQAGTIRVTDAMPVAAGDAAPLDGVWEGKGRHRVIRLVEARGAEIEVHLEARLAFDFATVRALAEFVPGRGALLHDGDARWLVLVWPGSLRQRKPGELSGSLRLAGGERAACVLAHARSEEDARALLAGEDWVAQVEETDQAWRRWSSGLITPGPYGDALLRSSLALKLLTFEPTGALVAAPTTSLPEEIGGVRNWDYRYCWLRDATFTLYALLLVGDRTAARAFWRWIGRTCGQTPPDQMQTMYDIHGRRELPERTLEHLEGYRGSRPVRVGNAASDQRQLDVYGELLDAFWLYYRAVGLAGEVFDGDADAWKIIGDVADYICDIWREPDQGMWEARSAPRHYVYSKVMCWVGLDRAVQLAEREPDHLARDVDRWTVERDAVRADVLANGYKAQTGSFTMAYDGDELDAALLRLPLVGFLPATDPRMVATIDRIQDQLGESGLLRRYDRVSDDGLPAGEGAFSICTFWLVDCLTALGRIEEARRLFERMLAYGSDLGLFAEEIDPVTGAALGNYPQAFTHLALIDAGVDLTEALARQQPVSGTAADRARHVHRGRADRAKPAP